MSSRKRDRGAIGRVKLVLAVGEELAVFGEEDEEEAVKEREGVGWAPARSAGGSSALGL